MIESLSSFPFVNNNILLLLIYYYPWYIFPHILLLNL